MPLKIAFTMKPHDGRPAKHSTRFDLDEIETSQEEWMKDFKPSFYVPVPVGRKSRRIRVTIEEL